MSRRQSSGVLALMVSAGLLLGGCGSPNSSSAQGSPSPSPSPSKATTIAAVDACSLVSADEASSVAKTTVTSQVVNSGICIYGKSDGTASVLILAQAYPDATAAAAVSPEQLAASMNGAYGISNAKPLSGVGDKAVEYTSSSPQGAGIVIFAFKANVVVMLAVVPVADPSDSTSIEKLAATAVGRIH